MMATITDFAARILPMYRFNLDAYRKRCLEKTTDPAMIAYLSTPLVQKTSRIRDIELLSLDFETTGLHAKNDQLLSIGTVVINKGKIQLSSSYHQLIRTDGHLSSENVAIHQIMDCEKEQGEELKSALDKLLYQMAGRVLLVHFAKIERGFLSEAFQQLYGVIPPMMFIDTLVVAKRHLDKKSIAYDPSALRLNNLRHGLNLPAYHAHNALNDAIATGEVLLAILENYHRGLKTRLKQVLL